MSPNNTNNKPTVFAHIKRRWKTLADTVDGKKKAIISSLGGLAAATAAITLIFTGSGQYIEGKYTIEEITKFSSRLVLELPEDVQADTVDLYIGETPIAEDVNIDEGIYVLPAILNPIEDVTLYFVVGRDLKDQTGNIVERSRMLGAGKLKDNGVLRIELDKDYAAAQDKDSENEGGGSK